MEILLVSLLEIGFVPTGSFQAKSGRRNKTPQSGLTTLGTIYQWLIVDTLKLLEPVLTRLALVFVNRHIAKPR